MTRGHSLEVKDPKYWFRHITKNLLNVLKVAGYTQVGQESPFARFEERLLVITNLALRLQTAVGVAITSMDLEPYVLPHKTTFDASLMEDTFASGSQPVAVEQIVGTTELGLKQLPADGSRSVVLLKAKVILHSAL